MPSRARRSCRRVGGGPANEHQRTVVPRYKSTPKVVTHAFGYAVIYFTFGIVLRISLRMSFRCSYAALCRRNTPSVVALTHAR